MKTREIKFRAWHIAEEKMCNVELIRPGDGAFLSGLIPEDDQVLMGGKVIIPGVESGRYCDIAEFHLMQFTGLKDKNGNEIYEGDILEMVMPISINGTHLHQVEIFSQGYAFWFKTTIYPGYTDCLWFHYNDSQRRIIGNIHQHPSLLTPQTDK